MPYPGIRASHVTKVTIYCAHLYDIIVPVIVLEQHPGPQGDMARPTEDINHLLQLCCLGTAMGTLYKLRIGAPLVDDRTMITLYTVIWILLLPDLIVVLHSSDLACRLYVPELEGITQPGDIMLGVILPLHLDRVYQRLPFTVRPTKTICSTFHLENYQQLQSMIFAVEEINGNPTILPNVTLGFQAYDSCDVLRHDLQGTLQILSGSNKVLPNYRCLVNVPLSVIIGPSISTHSILVAHILGLYKYPQISHFSTSPLLSDRTKFPSFFRTVSNDVFQSQGLSQLVLHFGWTWIGLLAVDNDYGQQGIQLVKKEIVKAGACVAFSENIITSQPSHNAPRIVKVLKTSTAEIVVVFSPAINLVPILYEMLKQDVTKKIFIASEAWSTSSLFSIGKLSESLSGTIGLAFYSGTIPKFQEFLNKIHPSIALGKEWTKLLWEQTFHCTVMDNNSTRSFSTSMKECTGSEYLQSVTNSFNDVSNLRATYNVYTAVHVVAKALEDLKSCKNGPLFFHKPCAKIKDFASWQLLYYMKKARVTLSNGKDFYFDENGDPPAIYDIVNWQLNPEGIMQHKKIGSYDTMASPGQVFTINTSAILWNTGNETRPISVCSESCPPGLRKAPLSGQPACCFQCVPCPQGEISNQTDSVDCIRCQWNEWPNAPKDLCLQKAIEYLSYEETLGSTLTCTSSVSVLIPVLIFQLYVKFKMTPIVKANNYYLSCLLLVSLSLCFLCSLLFIGFPKHETCLLRQAGFGLAFTLCISCVLAKTIMVVFAFMATKPGSNLRRWTSPKVSYAIIFLCTFLQFIMCITWLYNSPPFPQNNAQVKPNVIIVECNEGSPIAFWIMLGYLFLLATISFIVAFLARRLPESFNEAQYITFSMLAFLSVWISYIPASLSAQGKYTVAMEVFAILASSWALVICMFFPKCFIILFRPETNSREFLMRKNPTCS
ncbi:extracellular calcium-sensing receptor-like [Hyla sarda]|uniref:extracellular calcium-sensing receptor-like n=1 Tax=Hyla sarda TaxID=327740 RepID=UPI0024C358A9|nr:extracellular calcium-sensing receptor-like [Hyla sarda]